MSLAVPREGAVEQRHQKRSMGETKEEMKKFGSDLLSTLFHQHPPRKPASASTDGMYPLGKDQAWSRNNDWQRHTWRRITQASSFDHEGNDADSSRRATTHPLSRLFAELLRHILHEPPKHKLQK